MTQALRSPIARYAQMAADSLQDAADYARQVGVDQDELADLLAPAFDKITEITGCEPGIQIRTPPADPAQLDSKKGDA